MRPACPRPPQPTHDPSGGGSGPSCGSHRRARQPRAAAWICVAARSSSARCRRSCRCRGQPPSAHSRAREPAPSGCASPLRDTTAVTGPPEIPRVPSAHGPWPVGAESADENPKRSPAATSAPGPGGAAMPPPETPVLIPGAPSAHGPWPTSAGFTAPTQGPGRVSVSEPSIGPCT